MPKNGKTEREGITIFIFLFLLSLLLIARLMTLFIEEGVINTNYRDPRIETEYFRGTIYDRSGNILAMDRNDYFLSIDSERVNEVSRFSSTVSPYVDINPVVLENMIRKGEKLKLRTNLLSSEIEAFLSLMRKENFDHLISLERIRERIYPSGVHGIEIIGREAESSSFCAESVYDSILEPPLSISDALSTGEDITLSMSQRMQYTADHIVASYKDENEYLMLALFDYMSGETYALALSSKNAEDIDFSAISFALDGKTCTILKGERTESNMRPNDKKSEINGRHAIARYTDNGFVLLSVADDEKKGELALIEFSQMLHF